ncbi:DUF6790 family protein [Candidatus Protochlamydia sp. W-9]|uniref:DUF6790 family protein n=1 Tax=Candidatus Protochlamydia sp. W-9 TaxID=1785087 RepID=UPI00096A679E|nr:DUF6790 family protein [Candidatus Protochlamydia sp. W-9]
MRKLFHFLLNSYSVLFFTITFACFLYYNLIEGENLSRAFLHAYLFCNIGVRGIVAFIANIYPPTALKIAKSYNWPEGASIQRELAAHMGAIGVLGILCLWFDGLFWLATVIAGTLSCLVSETANFAIIFKEKIHPFVKREIQTSYVVSKSLFAGMLLDVSLSLFSLILGLMNLIPAS